MPFPILAALPVIGDIVKGVFGDMQEAVEDAAGATELKASIQTQLMTLDYSAFEQEIEKRAEIIVAEATGASWLQRNWRPLLMVCFGGAIVWNYVAVDIATWGFMLLELIIRLYRPDFPQLPVPPRLDIPGGFWTLVSLGVSGYVVGRTGEKVAETVADAWTKVKGGGER